MFFASHKSQLQNSIPKFRQRIKYQKQKIGGSKSVISTRMIEHTSFLGLACVQDSSIVLELEIGKCLCAATFF